MHLSARSPTYMSNCYSKDALRQEVWGAVPSCSRKRNVRSSVVWKCLKREVEEKGRAQIEVIDLERPDDPRCFLGIVRQPRWLDGDD